MSHSNTNDAANSPQNTHYSHNADSLNSFQIVDNFGATDEKSKILARLSPIEPRIRHQNIRTRRAGNIGEWLLETDEFQKWCGGAQAGGLEHAVLFCCGDPAVGKTYFSSLVVDNLCDKSKEENPAIACFYIDFAAREEQSPAGILGSLLKQIVAGLGRIPDEISRTFQDHKKIIGGRGLRVPEIVKMLQIVTSSQPTYICVDALDECVEDHRPKILDSLSQILEKSPDTRIFLTGRRYIENEIERHFSGKVATLSIRPSNADIVEYIRMRLSMDSYQHAIDSGLEAEIIKSITENVPGT